jgi:Fe2+ transport system protein FeoA
VTAGTAVEILRVSDRDPRLLQYLAERGLRPGATVSVESVDELAGVITLSVDGTTSTLALTTVTEISVRV